ncbi:MAG: exodeoxyribonuclease VII large subunit [Erysipelotrichaceae bacterium]|nr:exodeoxyribonuclease VII large subunit [Erysipelotrichaceae bacterium]
MRNNEWTITRLVKYLKNKLDSDTFIQSIWILGEISNFTAHASGHFYFTLKDSGSRISCIMFASYASRVDFRPLDGQKVLVRANTSIYEKSGQIQLFVTEITDHGKGVLYQRYLMLKQKLDDEGYFNENHKKSLLKYPFKIALVTGENTAARQDVLITLARRWPIAKVVEFGCLVQGENAYLSIISALAKADQSDCDLILLVRGGGSIEDLWSFNEENLIKFIFELKTPVITGIGHETDTTLSDLVSDLRANTPTGAAELATPSMIEVKQQLNDNFQRLIQIAQRLFKNKSDQLMIIKNNQLLNNPDRMIQRKSIDLIMLIKTLEFQRAKKLEIRNDINNKYDRLLNINKNVLYQSKVKIDLYHSFISNKMITSIDISKQNFKNYLDLLNAYSPLNIIKKGYAIIEKDKKVIKSINEVDINDVLALRLNDGKLHVIVDDKE